MILYVKVLLKEEQCRGISVTIHVRTEVDDCVTALPVMNEVLATTIKILFTLLYGDRSIYRRMAKNGSRRIRMLGP